MIPFSLLSWDISYTFLSFPFLVVALELEYTLTTNTSSFSNNTIQFLGSCECLIIRK